MTDTENNENQNSPEPEKEDNNSNNEKNLNLNELEGSQENTPQEKNITDSEDDDEVRMASDLEPVYEIPVQVSAVLGKTRMQVSDLLKLGQGAVVELDRRVGEAIDIYVNKFHWPAFNLADSCITIGGLTYIWLIFYKKSEQNS